MSTPKPMAFPSWELNGQNQPEMNEWGMELRDYFAASALQGLLAYTSQRNTKEAAEHAYAIADAMMKARQCSSDS